MKRKTERELRQALGVPDPIDVAEVAGGCVLSLVVIGVVICLIVLAVT